MYTLLLIDDDERLAELLEKFLQRYEFKLLSATRPSVGLKIIQEQKIDLIILDVMLPEMDGFEVCKQIRKDSEIPIIMLTARGDVMDRVVGLEIGADDYLPKPFEPRELVARILRILKRSHGNQSSKSKVLHFKDLKIDLDSQIVLLFNQPVEFTSAEFETLCMLAQSPGKTFSRDEILNQLKGIDSELYSRAVDIQISRIRHKLKPLDYIKTVRGAGYRFAGQSE